MGVIRTSISDKKPRKPTAARAAAAQQRPTRPTSLAGKGIPSEGVQQTQQQHDRPGADAWWLADVAFVVEGKTLQAHKVVLASRSRYFATLFQSHAAAQYEIAEFPHAVFSQFIRWCYAGQRDVATDTALELRACAVAYDAPDLLLLCNASLEAARLLAFSPTPNDAAPHAPVSPLSSASTTGSSPDGILPPAVSPLLPAQHGSELNDLGAVWASVGAARQPAGLGLGISPQAVFGMEIS